MARDDAASLNVRHVAQIDAEEVEDRERVVGEKLAAKLVARKRVSVDQCDADAARRQQRGERRSARARADDGDVYFHNTIPNRNGQSLRTSARGASTRDATSRASAIV